MASAYNPKLMLRQISAPLWQAYWSTRQPLPENFPYDAEAEEIIGALFAHLDSLNHEDNIKSYSELRRVFALSNNQGSDALINAHATPENIQAAFEDYKNPFERALFMFIYHPETFCSAETLAYFDQFSNKRSWSRSTIPVTEPVSFDPVAYSDPC